MYHKAQFHRDGSYHLIPILPQPPPIHTHTLWGLRGIEDRVYTDLELQTLLEELECI